MMPEDMHPPAVPSDDAPRPGAIPDALGMSIVICTYNRAGLLRECLEGVLRQTLPQSAFELIVVDNNSSDQTPQVCEEFRDRFAHFSYVSEPGQGIARARNAGWRAAGTELIAYLDDDTFPHENWAETLRDTTRSQPDAAVIGGECEPLWLCERPDWLSDPLLHYYSCNLCWSETPRFIRGREWFAEGNSAYRRAALAAHGGFPESLGRKGALLLSGEGAINDVMAAHGLGLFYTPHARVRHRIDPDRLDPHWLADRCFWGGVSAAIVEEYIAEKTGTSTPWRDLRLPAGIRDWEHMVNRLPDDNLPESMRKLSDLGYLLARTGLVRPQEP